MSRRMRVGINAFPPDGGFHNEWSHMDWSLQVIYLSVSLPKEIFSLITH